MDDLGNFWMALVRMDLEDQLAGNLVEQDVSNLLGRGITVDDPIPVVDENDTLLHGAKDCFENGGIHAGTLAQKITWKPDFNKCL